MSWLYSRALVEAYLPESCLDGEPSAPLNGNRTQQAYCAPDKMTDFSRLSRFGMTYKPLTANHGEALLKSYLEAFHAKTSQPLEKVLELTENDQECGHTWRGWLAKYDPDTSSWKTAQCSLLEDLNESLATLPRWGMTRNGLLWEQPTLEPITNGTESGLLPRPTMQALNGGSNSRKSAIARGNWPTPQARDWKDSQTAGNRKSPGLGVVAHWATPTVCGNYNRKGASKNSGDGLATQAGGSLNPTWVEWLMGWPLGWTDLKPLETDKSPSAPQPHGDC
jgi:hypothetical protein